MATNTSSPNAHPSFLGKPVHSVLHPRETFIGSTDRPFFIDAPKQKACFITENNPKMFSAKSTQTNDFKPNNQWTYWGITSFSTLGGGIGLGDNMLKMEGKSIYNARFVGKPFKWIAEPSEQLLEKTSKIVNRISANSPAAAKYLKQGSKIASEFTSKAAVKVGSKVVKKVPLLGLGIASYNIRQSYQKRGNSFEFWADASLEVIDAFSPIPFTKEIIEGSMKYETEKAKDFVENRDRYLFMPLHAGKV